MTSYSFSLSRFGTKNVPLRVSNRVGHLVIAIVVILVRISVQPSLEYIYIYVRVCVCVYKKAQLARETSSQVNHLFLLHHPNHLLVLTDGYETI